MLELSNIHTYFVLYLYIFSEEEDAEDLKTRCDFSIGDAFMVLGYVDYDMAGLMGNEHVVSDYGVLVIVVHRHRLFLRIYFFQNFTPAHVQSYMKQLLTGVHYMHKNNILHRDIKGS